MKQTIYCIVGVPGSGKTWVTSQVAHKYEFVHHDGFIGHINQPQVYVDAILEKAQDARKPLLIEAPFSMSQILGPLREAGYKVVPVFILEKPEVVSLRYLKREGKMIPKGHLTRMNTYAQRAKSDIHSFAGTSSEVLQYLQSK